jgi:hypothetical protein
MGEWRSGCEFGKTCESTQKGFEEPQGLRLKTSTRSPDTIAQANSGRLEHQPSSSRVRSVTRPTVFCMCRALLYRDEIASLAFLAARPNRKISSRPPDEYLAEIAVKHRGRLEAQSIPMDPKLWKVERFQDFLAARRQMLAAAVNDLIKNPV